MDDLEARLGRIEGKLDILLEDRRDLERRVGRLERWRSWVVGGCAAIGGIITLMAKGS